MFLRSPRLSATGSLMYKTLTGFAKAPVLLQFFFFYTNFLREVVNSKYLLLREISIIQDGKYAPTLKLSSSQLQSLLGST